MHTGQALSAFGSVAPALGAVLFLASCPALAQENANEVDLGPNGGQQETIEGRVADFAEQNAAAEKQSCQIVVLTNGRLAPNVGATKLSSLGYSGEAGRAEVTTSNGSFYVSVDQPLGFVSAPQGGNNDIVFATWISGRGKTNFGDTPGQNRVKLKNGKTNMEIGLEVIKQSGAFPTGRYQAELTLRCE